MIRVVYGDKHLEFQSEAADLWTARFAGAKRAEVRSVNDVPSVWQASGDWLGLLLVAAIAIWLVVDLARWIT